MARSRRCGVIVAADLDNTTPYFQQRDGVDGARTGISLDESCAKMVVVEQPSEGAPSMGKSITDLSSVTTVGLDLAKHVFQVHGVDASGRVIVAKAFPARTCWPSSPNCPSVLSVWKPAVRPIIGRA